MKRGILSILFALVLVTGLSLVTAVPVMAEPVNQTVTGDGEWGFTLAQMDQQFSTETIDASVEGGVILSGSVTLGNFDTGAGDDVWYEAGLVSNETYLGYSRLHNKGVYMIALWTGTDYIVHIQNVPTVQPTATGNYLGDGDCYLQTSSASFDFEIKYHNVTATGGNVDLRINDGISWTEWKLYQYAEDDVETNLGKSPKEAAALGYDADDDLTDARIVSQIFVCSGTTATFTAAYDNIQVNGTPYTLAPRVLNVDTGKGYTAIQLAIDAPETDTGDTIAVAAGEYDEKVFVNKSVTLEGAQAGQDARGRTGVESIINPNAAYVVVVQANDVTIDGFEITSTVDWNCDTAGIYVSDSIGQPDEGGTELSGVVIKNNIIHDLTDGNRDGGNGIYGIIVGPKTDGVEVCYNEIRDLHIVNQGWTPIGIIVWGNFGEEAKNTNVHDNLVFNLENDNIGVQPRGIQFSNDVWGGTIANNEIYDIVRGRGIRLYADGNEDIPSTGDGSVSVVGNNIHDCGDCGILVEFLATVTGNTLNSNAIQIIDSDEFLTIEDVLTNNTFDRAVTVDHASLLHTIWSSIQDGINAASFDDTVLVAAGTYVESVYVWKPLTISSTDVPETTILDASEAGWGSNGFTVIASDVTIEGFTVYGPQEFNSAPFMIGGLFPGDLRHLGVEYVTVRGNIIKAKDADHPTWTAVYIWKSSGNLIEGNKIVGTVWRAIQVYDGSTDAEIAYVEGVSKVPGSYDGSCQFEHPCSRELADHMYYQTWDGIQLNPTDGDLVCPSQYNRIIGNEIANGQFGGIFVGAWPPSGGLWTDNTGTEITGNYIHDDSDIAMGTAFSSGSKAFSGNTMETCRVGIYIFGDGVTDVIAHYNNIVNNTEFGVLDETPGTIDATYNWWGSPTGPGRKTHGKWLGKGDEVSDNVNYKPWLHKSKEKIVPKKKPAYARSVVLDNTGDYGWNTFSAPIFLDDEADIWEELHSLAELDYSVAYRFDSDIQEFVPLTTTDDYAISPGEGFFIKMNDVGCLAILYSTEENLTPPSRPLTAGWNLIGLASLEDMNVDDAFASIATAPGLAGYSQVVSPIGNITPGPVLTDGIIYVGESYWVYMLGARTLAGFTMTPVGWVP